MIEYLQVNRRLKQFLPQENKNTLVLVTGARQTGKTTLVKDFYNSLNYFNLDAIELREQLSSISSFNWHRDVGISVIEEVQKEISLFDKIKYSFDEKLLSFSVLTGSSQILLQQKIKETLAGRIQLFELFPLMLSEVIDPDTSNNSKTILFKLLNSKSIDPELNKLSSVLLGENWDYRIRHENFLIKWGGMPKLLHIEDDDSKINWLRDYTSTYLERDLMDLANFKNLSLIKKFQSIAALRSANLLQYSEIAKDTGISNDTARNYMNYLNISYQSFLLQPYYKNITSSLIKTPKVFWYDNGLLRYISGYGFQIENGQLYENYVGSELMKFIKTTKTFAKLYFYRTRSGMEIDFIVETPNGIIAIEAKNREFVSKKDFNSISKVAELMGYKFIGGIVSYKGNKIEKFGENLWAIPSCRLFS